MNVVRRVLEVAAVLYAMQLTAVLYFELAPVAELDLSEERYVIRRGYTLPRSLIPALGAIALLPEVEVTLSVYDREGSKRVEKGFDAAIDVYEAYPAIWSERGRRNRRNPTSG